MTKEQIGWWANLTEPEYEALPGLRGSVLSGYAETALHGHYKETHRKDSDAFFRGRLTHVLTLTPELFDTHYVEIPDLTTGLVDAKGQPYKNPKATNAYKDALAKFGAENSGKAFVTPELMTIAQGMSDAVHEHPDAAAFLERAEYREIAGVWQDAKTRALLKGRLDAVVPEFSSIGDLKTCQSAAFFPMAKSVGNYRYYLQGANYVDGARALGFDVEYYVLICVEVEPPHAVAVYRITDELLEIGRRMRTKLIDLYQQCQAENYYPGYPEGVTDITLPKYMLESLREQYKK